MFLDVFLLMRCVFQQNFLRYVWLFFVEVKCFWNKTFQGIFGCVLVGVFLHQIFQCIVGVFVGVFFNKTVQSIVFFIFLNCFCL